MTEMTQEEAVELWRKSFGAFAQEETRSEGFPAAATVIRTKVNEIVEARLAEVRGACDRRIDVLQDDVQLWKAKCQMEAAEARRTMAEQAAEIEKLRRDEK